MADWLEKIEEERAQARAEVEAETDKKLAATMGKMDGRDEKLRRSEEQLELVHKELERKQEEHAAMQARLAGKLERSK